MPGSSPLEPLSSPSPSPAPRESPPPHEEQHIGLDSGSELSELTEDEDNDAREDDAVRAAARKKKQRDRIVPQPMWGWSVKKKPEKKDKSDWHNKLVEEEEEEEQAGPAKAMEEEEDDDQDRVHGSDRDLTPEPDRDDALTDNEADVNDDDDQPEDEPGSADEAPPYEPRNHLNGELSGDEAEDPEEPELEGPDAPLSPKVAASPDLTDDENDNVAEDDIEEEDAPEVIPAAKEPSEVDEDDEDAPPDEVDVPDAEEPPTTEAVTPAEGIVDAPDADPDVTMSIDAAPKVLMSPVAVAVSSIMGAASLIQRPSPGSSQQSSPSGSRASSRFPSAEPEQEPEVPSEPEVEPEPERKPAARGARNRKGKGRTRAARRSRAAAAAELADNDADADQADLQDGEGMDVDDLDAATPDLDLDADMQPAHRAEALEVLAQIELKFALLRERLYVEKMDSLAWEEGLIANGTHPELLHLHAELSSRRDKRLELASRRRDYEIENATKRRKLDEAGAWTTWKYERDQLQKQMISEANGKKRSLERQRRSLERPQGARPLPQPLIEVPPAQSLREIVKSSPFGLPDSALPLGKRSRKKEVPPQGPLVYPTLSSLSTGEVNHDLDIIFGHRNPMFNPTSRHVPELMNLALNGGVPYGMDMHGMGMQMFDGPNRYAPPQQLPPQSVVQGFGPPPRLLHHHSAPSGAMTHIPHQQLPMDQDILGVHPPPGVPGHPSQQQFGPGPGPSTLMRRSLSPVPLSNGAGPSSLVPTTIGGGPIPPGFSGTKPNGWSGTPSSSKEYKRVNGEADGRERERLADGITPRDRTELDLEREREERAHHMALHQSRHTTLQHPHQHVHSSGQASGSHHHGSHNHQRHHHHVHHHHHQHAPHPGVPHGQPMSGLPPNGTLSPQAGRDFEQRRPRSGAPTEIIELSAPPQKPPVVSPQMSAFWKGNNDDMYPPTTNELQRQRERERERDDGKALGPSGPTQAGAHEQRLMTPFTMGPSQGNTHGSTHQNLHGPRNAGPSDPSSSMSTSRRRSWSEEYGMPRPSPSIHSPAFSPNQRPSTTRAPQPLPTPTSSHNPFGSPPHNNGRVQHTSGSPSSFAFAGSQRSPTRSTLSGRPTVGSPFSPPSARPFSPPGARMHRPPSPGPGKAAPTKLSGFPIPEGGNIAPIATGMRDAPAAVLLPPARIVGGPLAVDKPGAPPPTGKVVPVDGP